MWRAVEASGAESIAQRRHALARAFGLAVDAFRAFAAYANYVSASNQVLPKALVSDAVVGLHAVTNLDHGFLLKAVAEASSPTVRNLGRLLKMDPGDMLDCLEESLRTLETTGHPTDRKCLDYWSRGAFLAHVGAGLTDAGVSEGLPAPVVLNALMPWILGVVKDIAYGSEAAGSIAVLGASIGQGKTTTLYYTFTSVLKLLGTPEPKATASKLILLDPRDFLDALQLVLEAGEKIPLLAVDNASVLFPKHWVRMGGEWARYFHRMNTVVDLLRSVCGVAIFVANAPDELASFVRNVATLNIRGVPYRHRLYSVTVFTYRRAGLVMRYGVDEEVLRTKQQISSVYAFPLLKLPPGMYLRDLESKREVTRSELAKAVESLRSALQEKTRASPPPPPHVASR